MFKVNPGDIIVEWVFTSLPFTYNSIVKDTTRYLFVTSGMRSGGFFTAKGSSFRPDWTYNQTDLEQEHSPYYTVLTFEEDFHVA